MKSLIQCNGVAFEANDQKWIANGILRLNVYEEDFKYMTPVIQPYPRSAIKPWSELHNPQLSSLPVTVIFSHADKDLAYKVALECYDSKIICVGDQDIEKVTTEAAIAYLWHEMRKAEDRIGRRLLCNNAECIYSVMQVLKRRESSDVLQNIGVSDDMVGLSFRYDFMGVEYDGYAHQ